MRPIDLVRRGTLYGAAVGLLFGLVAVTLRDEAGRVAIITWRTWILAFAGVGLVTSVVLALMRRHIEADNSEQPPCSP